MNILYKIVMIIFVTAMVFFTARLINQTFLTQSYLDFINYQAPTPTQEQTLAVEPNYGSQNINHARIQPTYNPQHEANQNE